MASLADARRPLGRDRRRRRLVQGDTVEGGSGGPDGGFADDGGGGGSSGGGSAAGSGGGSLPFTGFPALALAAAGAALTTAGVTVRQKLRSRA